MKNEFEKQAFCSSGEARIFVRNSIAKRKRIARKQAATRPEALDVVFGDESLEALSDDELVLTIFYSEQIPDVRIAKEVCLQCPVIEACLQSALKNGETYGVWGGQFFKEGILDQPKRRGRPPKVARPEFEVFEVPISKTNQRFIDSRASKPLSNKEESEQKANKAA